MIYNGTQGMCWTLKRLHPIEKAIEESKGRLCSSIWKSVLTPANTLYEEYSVTEKVLSQLFTIITAFANIWYIWKVEYRTKEQNDSIDTPYDYTLMIKKIDRNETKDSIQKFFEQVTIYTDDRKPFKPSIRNVNCAYFIGTFIELCDKRSAILKSITYIQNEIDAINGEKQKNHQQLFEQIKRAMYGRNSVIPTNMSIVKFSTNMSTVKSKFSNSEDCENSYVKEEGNQVEKEESSMSPEQKVVSPNDISLPLSKIDENKFDESTKMPVDRPTRNRGKKETVLNRALIGMNDFFGSVKNVFTSRNNMAGTTLSEEQIQKIEEVLAENEKYKEFESKTNVILIQKENKLSDLQHDFQELKILINNMKKQTDNKKERKKRMSLKIAVGKVEELLVGGRDGNDNKKNDDNEKLGKFSNVTYNKENQHNGLGSNELYKRHLSQNNRFASNLPHIDLKKGSDVENPQEEHCEIPHPLLNCIDNVDQKSTTNQAKPDVGFIRKSTAPVPNTVDIEQLVMSKWAKRLNTSKHLEFTGIAFVVFNEQSERNKVLRIFEKSRLQTLVDKFSCCKCTNWRRTKYAKKQFPQYNDIEVLEPPEPIDIYWENLGFDRHTQMKSNCINFFITIFLFVAVIAIITILKYSHKTAVKKDPKAIHTEGHEESTYGNIILGIVFSSVIGLCNVVLSTIFRKMSEREKFPSWTDYSIAVAWRISLGQWFNSSLVVVISSMIIYGNNVQENVWDSDGLLNDAFYILLSNWAVHPQLNVFNMKEIIRQWKIFKIKKNPKAFTQQEANTAFEGVQPEIADWYADACSSLMNVLFFMPVMPYGIIIGILNQVTQYWSDKYWILKICARPQAQGFKQAEFMIYFFDYCLIAFAIGQIVWDLILRSRISGFTIAIAVIVCLLKIMRATLIQKVFIKEKENKKREEQERKKREKKMQEISMVKDSYDMKAVSALKWGASLKDEEKVEDQPVNLQKPKSREKIFTSYFFNEPIDVNKANNNNLSPKEPDQSIKLESDLVGNTPKYSFTPYAKRYDRQDSYLSPKDDFFDKGEGLIEVGQNGIENATKKIVGLFGVSMKDQKLDENKLNCDFIKEKDKKIARSAIPNYETARVNFIMEYERANPITQLEATKEWLEFISFESDKFNKKINSFKNEFAMALRNVTMNVNSTGGRIDSEDSNSMQVQTGNIDSHIKEPTNEIDENLSHMLNGYARNRSTVGNRSYQGRYHVAASLSKMKDMEESYSEGLEKAMNLALFLNKTAKPRFGDKQTPMKLLDNALDATEKKSFFGAQLSIVNNSNIISSNVITDGSGFRGRLPTIKSISDVDMNDSGVSENDLNYVERNNNIGYNGIEEEIRETKQVTRFSYEDYPTLNFPFQGSPQEYQDDMDISCEIEKCSLRNYTKKQNNERIEGEGEDMNERKLKHQFSIEDCPKYYHTRRISNLIFTGEGESQVHN